MCSSSMAGDDGRGRRSCQTVAVILVLCSLAPSLTCFSLRRLGENVEQDKEVNEATVMEVRTGRILFNGKELDSQSKSASATENDGSLYVNLDHSDGTGNWEQMSQLEDATAHEAEWRRLNPSLHCGQNKMKFKAMGPGAAHLKLQMGNAHPLPLIQVPEPCGYSMKQNARGLVLVVSYSGCNVIQENGNYVLLMSWLETPVKFTCPILSPSSAKHMPAQQPWKQPLPDGLGSLNRHKRQTTQSLLISDPRSPFFPYWYYRYLYGMTTTAAPGMTTTTAEPDTTATTTTAEPDTTTTTAEPDTTMTTTTAEPDTTTAEPGTTTTTPTQTRRPVYPYYPWFLYYLYSPYYYYYYYYYYYPYYALPNVPAMTTTSDTTTPPPTTTANATTGPTTTEMATSASMTTTAPASTTKTPQKPQDPYYRPYYYPYPYYPPGGQVPGMPDNADIYYNNIMQHYYGKPPYPQNPNVMLPGMAFVPPATTAAKADETTATTTTSEPTTTATCDKATTGKTDETTSTTTPETTTTAKICTPAATTKPGQTTTTTMPETTTTKKPTDSSPTTKPTTASGPTTAPTTSTTKPSTQTTKPSDEYSSPGSTFSPYYQFPFPPYLAYKHNKAGKFPFDQKYMPQPSYKSGLQARAHPPPHPGFNHWQPVPWFPHATGRDMRPVDWKNLQPKQV